VTTTERIGAINQARRDNIAQRHKVSPAGEHAAELVVILLGAVAEGKS
jgi:hypothetical protein